MHVASPAVAIPRAQPQTTEEARALTTLSPLLQRQKPELEAPSRPRQSVLKQHKFKVRVYQHHL